MAAHKLYPHERLIKNLKADHKGFSINDIEDEDIHNALKKFEHYRSQVRPGILVDVLVEASREIADEINEYMDTKYDEEDHEDHHSTSSKSNPVFVTQEVQKPIAREVVGLHPKPQNPHVSFISKMSKDEQALDVLYKGRKTSGLTPEDLEKAGFNTSFWGDLNSRGFKGKFYALQRSGKEKIYTIVKL